MQNRKILGFIIAVERDDGEIEYYYSDQVKQATVSIDEGPQPIISGEYMLSQSRVMLTTIESTNMNYFNGWDNFKKSIEERKLIEERVNWFKNE